MMIRSFASLTLFHCSTLNHDDLPALAFLYRIYSSSVKSRLMRCCSGLESVLESLVNLNFDLGLCFLLLGSTSGYDTLSLLQTRTDGL